MRYSGVWWRHGASNSLDCLPVVLITRLIDALLELLKAILQIKSFYEVGAGQVYYLSRMLR